MIADLESEWGITLLVREHDGVHLAAAGEEILPYAKKLCDDYYALQNQVNELNGLQKGTVRIGTFSSVATHWLPGVFSVFQKRYPGIEYEMLLGDYDEIENWIVQGRVDCGFLSAPVKTGLETVSLKKDEYVVVLPPKHPLAGKSSIDIHELEHEPFMLLEHGGRTEVSRLLDEYGVHPDIRFTTWEDYAIMAMVEKGLGLSILPSMILQRVPYRLEVRPLKKPFYREICLAVRNKTELSPAAKRFMEYIMTVLPKLSASR
jgi:DNA-binding transcriptional LysR family regulator